MDMTIICNEWDLSEWEFGESEKLNDIIAEAASEALKTTFDENPPWLSLPIQWSFGEHPSDGYGGKPVDDPLTIYLSLWISEDKPPLYRASLRDLAMELVDNARPGGELGALRVQDIDGTIRAFVRALHILADDIEKELELECQPASPPK